MKSEKICIMGLGYIGLPIAALLATKGYKVLGVDVKSEVVDKVNKGLVHIAEPELDTFMKSAVQSGNLTASMTPEPADIFIIAVQTPVDKNNQPDITRVVDAVTAIAPLIRQDNLLIIESTCPVGTTEKMAALLREKGINTDDIQIAFSSERVVPGQTIRELMQNDRVVGGITTEAALHVALFYESFVQGEVIITNSRTAEMSKLAENACRDVNIAFANELSFLCARAGVDVWELISLANRHPRINILKPGSGVGGHCVGIDPWFIVADCKEDALIMRTAREINGAKPKWVADQVKEAAKQFKEKNNKVPKIACMGLAYKPDIDDLRESPSLIIARQLIAEGLDIIISEPNLEEHKSLKLTEYLKAVNEADIIVFLVAHKEFRSVKVPEGKPVLDICGVRSKFVK